MIVMLTIHKVVCLIYSPRMSLESITAALTNVLFHSCVCAVKTLLALAAASPRHEQNRKMTVLQPMTDKRQVSADFVIQYLSADVVVRFSMTRKRHKIYFFLIY